MTKKQKAAEIEAALIKRYPMAKCSLISRSPHELLIATRLSAQCTDARVNIVTVPLFEKYRTVEDFAAADISDIENIIHSCGLYKTKAHDIVMMCRQLIENFDGQVPDTIEQLTTLSGVGRKTANLIVGDVFGKPAVVTDTHLIRIANRLGLVDTKDPAAVEREMKKLLNPETSNSFCHRCVDFGRDVCKAPTPKCELCELTGICKHYNELQRKAKKNASKAWPNK